MPPPRSLVRYAEILDVLPELTRRFDVVIIDDGSTDATAEVGQELAYYYRKSAWSAAAIPLAGRPPSVRAWSKAGAKSFWSATRVGERRCADCTSYRAAPRPATACPWAAAEEPV